jgi:hypothetical protein
VLIGALVLCVQTANASDHADAAHAVLRVATFNTSLNDNRAGGLIARLRAGDAGARNAAAVLQRVRPDIVLLNEFDFDAQHVAADLFQRRYLERGQFGERPLRYAYRYLAPVNTGVPSAMDLDRDGRNDGPGDAWGYGAHPGQYGMLLLSRYPLRETEARTFQQFRWHDMPDAKRPTDPAHEDTWYYDDAAWRQLRLSSKSHWDVPIDTPMGTLHVLAHHPTPPVFDGPEDRNGTRNFDEIRLWADYISSDATRHAYLYDDHGMRGGLAPDASFVILGDHNADPFDGESFPGTIAQLLQHPRVLATPVPASAGAVEAARRDGGANAAQRGDARYDTGNFGPRVGNLRIDYVLPSRTFRIVDSGVFWPAAGDPAAQWLETTDHHLVWVDLAR